MWRNPDILSAYREQYPEWVWDILPVCEVWNTDQTPVWMETVFKKSYDPQGAAEVCIKTGGKAHGHCAVDVIHEWWQTGARVCDFSVEDRVTYDLEKLKIDPLIIHLVTTYGASWESAAAVEDNSPAHTRARQALTQVRLAVLQWSLYNEDLLHYNAVFTMNFTMKSVSVCVCVHGQVMDLNLGDPGVTECVDDLLRMDGDTTIEQEKEGDECYGAASLMFTPPPRHPIFTHFH